MANSKEKIGVHHCGEIAARKEWMFREQPIDDIGIDAHMELTEKTGKAKQLLALQIKTGESYFKEKKGEYIVFRDINERQYNYWTTNSLPCIVVLYNPKDDMCIWQKLTKETILKTYGGTGKGYFVNVPINQIFLDDTSNNMLLTYTNLPEHVTNYNFLLSQKKFMQIIQAGGTVKLKDYEKAYFWYMKEAESGHAIAMYYLAWMYKRGDGIKEDPEKAFYWFEKAAEKGNVYAICNVGDCYKKGYYVKRDYVKAAEWYKKGEHSSICCLALGELYELGNGVEKDLEKAMHYYETAEILGGVGDSPKKAMERVERKIRHMKTW